MEQQKTFEGIRIRSDFDKVINNTSKLILKIKTKIKKKTYLPLYL